MHEVVLDPSPRRPRQFSMDEGPPNGTGHIPTCEPSSSPINRTLSTEKHIGNAQVRVLLPNMKAPTVLAGLAIKQYTKLPDHRPPLRRDKPVRISLPDNPPRYIFPAADRSFTFIPRNMRPNQQRVRGKPRSNWGSVGGFSRRTSVYGGSFYGSAYSPNIALSRRSSVGHEPDFMFSPTGSIISRPTMPADNARPIVRLPPSAPRLDMPIMTSMPPPMLPQMQPHVSVPGVVVSNQGQLAANDNISSTEPQQAQLHVQPLPQRPVAVPENRPGSIPMHQPRPQKNISVADIEPPALAQGAPPFQQAFHQQVPVQVANGYSQDLHMRRPSYSSQQASGTPLSHIPERAIHAAPFQPTTYGQPSFYGQQVYQPQPPLSQGYYYPPGYSGSAGAGHGYVAGGGHQSTTSGNFTRQNQGEGEHAATPQGHTHTSSTGGSNLVAQEVNGMVYYYDASQIPSVSSYPSYSAPQPYQPSVMGVGGMVTPSPDGFYYPQHASGMVYYPQ